MNNRGRVLATLNHKQPDKIPYNIGFYEGISTQKTLPYGTVDQVRDEVKQLLEIIGKDGGYIAAHAHEIPGDAKQKI